MSCLCFVVNYRPLEQPVNCRDFWYPEDLPWILESYDKRLWMLYATSKSEVSCCLVCSCKAWPGSLDVPPHIVLWRMDMGAGPVICCKEKVYYDYRLIDKVQGALQAIRSLAKIMN